MNDHETNGVDFEPFETKRVGGTLPLVALCVVTSVLGLCFGIYCIFKNILD